MYKFCAQILKSHCLLATLNRLERVWYTGLGGDDTGSVRPALPAGVEATADVVMQYNTTAPGNGGVSRVDDGAGYETYSYDSLGRNTAKSRVIDGYTFTTSYEYNQVGQQTAIIYPSNKRVRTNYDARGRFIGLDKMNGTSVALSYLSSVGYSVAGQVTGLALGNGVAESYGYSQDRLQMTSQTATKSGNTLMSVSYNYTAAAGQSGAATTAGNSGQLMGMTATINGAGKNQAFTYDNVGRLKTAAGWNSATNRRFDYDRWGNRVGVWNATSGGTQIQSVTLQQPAGVTNNRIASVGGVNYVYDAVGDVTNDGAHAYQYDGESRLVKVDGGATAINTYDAANRRVKKQTAAGTTWYVWEGGQVIAEYGAASQGSGGTRYYHPDRLSTRMITNSSGAVVGTQDHLPFGEDAGVLGESEKHRFTNYERDAESGTDYAVNRQYSTATGRFLRPDPVAGSILNPQSINRYAYTGNDPINFVDPLGLLTCFMDGMQVPCSFVISYLQNGDFEKVSYWIGGFAYVIDRNNYYVDRPPSKPDTDEMIYLSVTFNNTAFEAAIQQFIDRLRTDGIADQTGDVARIRGRLRRTPGIRIMGEEPKADPSTDPDADSGLAENIAEIELVDCVKNANSRAISSLDSAFGPERSTGLWVLIASGLGAAFSRSSGGMGAGVALGVNDMRRVINIDRTRQNDVRKCAEDFRRKTGHWPPFDFR